MDKTLIHAFTDGSIDIKNQNAPWGYIILLDNKEIRREKGFLTGDILKMYQIGAELKAVMEVIKFCKFRNYKAKIFHDYLGCSMWVIDFFDKNQKLWKCKNKYTQAYREYISKNLDYIEEFIHVKGHGTDLSDIPTKWNNEIDKFIRLK